MADSSAASATIDRAHRPFIAAALVVKSGDIYYGLWYPVVAASVTAIVGGFLIKERRGVDLRATQ